MIQPTGEADPVPGLPLKELLEQTSRTFALAIPMLPRPLREQVGLAYLLFRIADTFEDGVAWSKERRLEALADLERLLDDPQDPLRRAPIASWTSPPPIAHAGYSALLFRALQVVDSWAALPRPSRQSIGEPLRRSIGGMATFVHRAGAQGRLQLDDLEDLRHYCYTVAGLVGEMLTELLLLHEPHLEPQASGLRSRARDFGEALQLVNILKDRAHDAQEGRIYLPSSLPLVVVFELARADVAEAKEYCKILIRGAASLGVQRYHATLVSLAEATLERTFDHGPGAKLSRLEVARRIAAVDAMLESGKVEL